MLRETRRRGAGKYEGPCEGPALVISKGGTTHPTSHHPSVSLTVYFGQVVTLEPQPTRSCLPSLPPPPRLASFLPPLVLGIWFFRPNAYKEVEASLPNNSLSLTFSSLVGAPVENKNLDLVSLLSTPQLELSAKLLLPFLSLHHQPVHHLPSLTGLCECSILTLSSAISLPLPELRVQLIYSLIIVLECC